MGQGLSIQRIRQLVRLPERSNAIGAAGSLSETVTNKARRLPGGDTLRTSLFNGRPADTGSGRERLGQCASRNCALQCVKFCLSMRLMLALTLSPATAAAPASAEIP